MRGFWLRPVMQVAQYFNLSKRQLTMVKAEGRSVKCYPINTTTIVGTDHGWCATCVRGTKPGDAGYCDPDHKNVDVSTRTSFPVLQNYE